MQGYKRNQVEEAISIAMGQGPTPSTSLRTNCKRLLDTDRSVGRNPRSKDPELANFAFYSDKAPGSGSEVWFSGYEVFALLLGLHFMAKDSTQARAVSILRRARPALEPKHAAILKWDPDILFDETKIREAAKPGSLFVQSTRPVFLVTASLGGSTAQASNVEAVVVEQDDLGSLSGRLRYPISIFELTRIAHDLRSALAKTEPSKRGRGRS